jgi:Tfp pilus assembly protein PilF
MSIAGRAKLNILIGIGLAILVLASYWVVTENQFIYFDDPQYVTENPHIQKGLNHEALIWAFTTSHASNWHPLTWLSLILDWDLFQMNAAGYHWTNVVLHLLSGLLLFAALNRMTALPWPSGVVAALFMIHPLHVESVAWVSERKDVLSGLFWMTGLWCYARYAESPGFVRYLWVVLSFVACLLSKPMGVTFPFVLLLLDWWPLKRALDGKARWASLVWEKMPLFLLSAVASVITFLIQKENQAMSPLSQMPLGDRMANSVVSYAAYLGKTFWPEGLCIFYPYNGPTSIECLISSVALLSLLMLIAVLLAKSKPYLIVGWLWYMGTLVPVIGLVQVGSQAMADRYTYLPLVGIFIVVVWTAMDLLEGDQRRKKIGLFISGSVMVVLIVLTQIQVNYWRDTQTLFARALQTTERNFMAHEILAECMAKTGNPRVVEAHYREAIRIKPAFKQAYNGLGHLLMIQGRQEEAGILLEKALKIDSTFIPAMKNLGDVRMRQGRLKEALLLYKQAVFLGKEDHELLNNYGVALFFKGEREDAIRQIRASLRLKPDYAEAQDNLRKILENMESRKSNDNKNRLKSN